MQQWEDWPSRQYWLLLSEKALLTAIVTGVTYFVWLVWRRHQDEAALQFTVELPAQLSENWETGSEDAREQHNAWEEVVDSKIYPRCPADGRSLQQDPILPATAQDIDEAIARASSAQVSWSKTTFSQRRRVLNTLIQYITHHQEEIVAACCLDSGKTKIDACLGEILVTVEKLQWTIKHGEAALAPSRRSTNLLMSYKRNTVHYEALGVVAACVSWNYPFHNFISPIIPALFSGNAIIVKPSELTCWSTQYFLSIIRKALVACEHNPEVVQSVICLPDVAEHLTSHPEISHITFIGSRPVAHKVALSAAKSLTPLVVELGGKDPIIVLDDPQTTSMLSSTVVPIILRGFFQSSGQNCIGLERLITTPKNHDLIMSQLVPAIKSLRLGSVLLDQSAPDIGAMISARSFTRLETLIQDAVSQGAVLHCGGTRYHHLEHPGGHYFLPTLISEVTTDMQIARTELFAPVCLVMRASSVTDAISIASSTEYALGAAVFGHHKPDVDRCVSEIYAGNVAVNDFATYYVCSMPFGGRNGSGYGRFGGDEGLRGLCNSKSVCEDAPWARLLGIQTTIPPCLRYPIDGPKGWEAVKGIVRVGYGIGLGERFRGLRGLLGALAGGGRRKE